MKIFVWSSALLFGVMAMMPATSWSQRRSQKYSLAVLNFSSTSTLITESDAAVLAGKFADEVSATGLFHAMSHQNMEKGLLNQAVDPFGCDNIDCAVKAGRSLGVQLVVLGTVQELDSAFIVETQMIHVSSKEVVKSQKEEFTRDLGIVYEGIPAFVRKFLGISSTAGKNAAAGQYESPVQRIPEPAAEPISGRAYYEVGNTGPSKWIYIGAGLLVAGGVGTALMLVGGDGGNSGGGGQPTTSSGILPGPPTFP